MPGKDIFLSYASDDRSRILPLVRALEGTGWTVFWDRKIPIGKTWADVLESEITTCRSVVVVWSLISVKSKWVRKEANEGDRRSVLFPVRIDEVDPPFEYREIQAADLIGWNGEASVPTLEGLVDDLSLVLGRPQRKAKEDEGTVVQAERARELKEQEERRRAEEKEAARTADREAPQAKEQGRQQAEEAVRRAQEAEQQEGAEAAAREAARKAREEAVRQQAAVAAARRAEGDVERARQAVLKARLRPQLEESDRLRTEKEAAAREAEAARKAKEEERRLAEEAAARGAEEERRRQAEQADRTAREEQEQRRLRTEAPQARPIFSVERGPIERSPTGGETDSLPTWPLVWKLMVGLAILGSILYYGKCAP